MSSQKKVGPRGPGKPLDERLRATWTVPARNYPKYLASPALGTTGDNWLTRWKRRSTAARNPNAKFPK